MASREVVLVGGRLVMVVTGGAATSLSLAVPVSVGPVGAVPGSVPVSLPGSVPVSALVPGGAEPSSATATGATVAPLSSSATTTNDRSRPRMSDPHNSPRDRRCDAPRDGPPHSTTAGRAALPNGKEGPAGSRLVGSGA